MTLRIRTTSAADEMISHLDAWWREHRTAVASQVTDELKRVCAILADNPNAGIPYRHRRIQGIRKYRLSKTPYYLYYVTHLEEGEIEVLALWSAVRKRGPPLKVR
ncbi:MAG: hypothetical protein A2289_25090 [Deltaproteobacteria bacterium RIFOXYA12_FULL_58_15]|nr:MAG: hypothetical protein A2289_25090 [Deltaproteobacteria bacterium RIFOXYA12_FULL_58_15]OGR11000.1 MAG: hypothetical protein A2341_11470 [Deltaproteobacteria bacterium RIFOXYB12_FULL_58_9]